eukprot:77881-Chlamydomonas_euryale.AAC.1
MPRVQPASRTKQYVMYATCCVFVHTVRRRPQVHTARATLDQTGGWALSQKEGHSYARSGATPYSPPAHQNVRTGLRAATALSRHVECGLQSGLENFSGPCAFLSFPHLAVVEV